MTFSAGGSAGNYQQNSFKSSFSFGVLDLLKKVSLAITLFLKLENVVGMHFLGLHGIVDVETIKKPLAAA